MPDNELRAIIKKFKERQERDYPFNWKRFVNKRTWMDVEWEIKNVLRLVRLEEGQKVLDIGGGVGNYLFEALKKGCVCYDLDFKDEFFDVIRYRQRHEGFDKYGEVHLLRGDACFNFETLPYKNDSFDRVFCFDVLTFHPNPKKLLNETRRVLKEEGTFVFDIANLYSYWSLFVPNRKSTNPMIKFWAKVIGNSLIRYSPNDIRMRLEDSKLILEDIRSIHFRPPKCPATLIPKMHWLEDKIGSKLLIGSKSIVSAARKK